MSKLPSHPDELNFYFHPNRLSFAPEGIFGGEDGTKTRVVVNGEAISGDPKTMRQGYVTIRTSQDRLEVEFPSGAGAHAAKERDPEEVKQDVRDQIVSPDAAWNEYGTKV